MLQSKDVFFAMFSFMMATVVHNILPNGGYIGELIGL